WEHYLSCDGSPDPTVLQEINTFMSLWRDDQNEDVQLVMEKGEQVLKLIEKLQFLLLDTPPSEITEKETSQYQESILELENLLHQKYNGATEHLLKVTNMSEDSESGNMQAVIKNKNVTFCIWANLEKKVRCKNHVFCGAQHGFDLPKSLAVSSVAVRILHTHYDHVSPLWLQENSNSRADRNETEEEMEKKSGILDTPPQGMWLIFSMQHGKILDPLMHEETNGKEEVMTDKNIVDLQQFMLVGGVYHIDALQLPPQAKQVKDWMMVELLDVGLEAYPYPPEEPEDATHPPIHITLRLSDNVMYFEDPLIARWDPAGQQWRTDGISNVTYDTQEKSVGFEMGAFYAVALLQDAHLNMPYRAWELQPTAMDEALLTITTVFATIQIKIKGYRCMLSSVVVEEKEVLSHVTGKWLSPADLRAVLKKAGVNIFPGEYSHKYVSVNKKVSPRVDGFPFYVVFTSVTFSSMMTCCAGGGGKCTSGLLSQGILLKASFFLPSEHLKADSVKDWSLYMFDGQKAQKLKITETSEAFSEELEEESEFHSTLYHMLKDFASKEAIAKVEATSFLFTDVVYHLLLTTRVLTYS
ncbi:CASC1 protein, partial [Eurystomus gularis]|nr:CASC1 protein [Eurystomus gularis]